MGNRIIPRYQRIQLSGDYDGVWIDVRVNPAMRLYDEFMSKDFERIKTVLATLVKASNVEDETGAPIDLSTATGLEQVPKDFLELMLNELMEAINPKATTPSSVPSLSSASETSPETTP